MCFRILVIGSTNSTAVRAAKAVAEAEKLEVITTWKSGERIPLLVVVNATARGDEITTAIMYVSGILGRLYHTPFRGPRIYVMAKSERATQEEMRLECCYRGGRVERFAQEFDSAVTQLRLMLSAAKSDFAEDRKLNAAAHLKLAQ